MIMAKKIRFPLEMESGVEVRSMEELKEHFSLTQILMYISNGKLVTWLRDRYADDIAGALEGLDMSDTELPRKVCELFDVPYDKSTEENLENAKERDRKQKLLKEYSSDPQHLKVVDYIAFSQDDLYDLLDEGNRKIYLCGDTFSIPLAKKGISYIGINNPTVIIDSKTEVDWVEKAISLSQVKYNEKYQAVIDSAAETKRKLYQHLVDDVKEMSSNHSCNCILGGYSKNSYLNFMLLSSDKKASEKYYNSICKEIENINYNIDHDVEKTKTMLISTGIIGLAENYIENL